MSFSVKKFFGGFAIWQGEKFGKVLFITVLLVIFGFIMWSAFIKPTRTDVQNLDQRLNLRDAQIENLTVVTNKPEPKPKRWSLISLRIWAKE